MSKHRGRALLVDDNVDNFVGEENYPDLYCMQCSEGILLQDAHRKYERDPHEVHEMSEAMDKLFDEEYDGEPQYRRNAGVSEKQLQDVQKMVKEKELTHVFFDHDLTLTLFHGLVSISAFNRFEREFGAQKKASEGDWTNMHRFIVYFFGSLARFDALVHTLCKLRKAGIRTAVLTRQPEPDTVRHFLKSIPIEHKKYGTIQYTGQYGPSFYHLFKDGVMSSTNRDRSKLDVMQARLNTCSRQSPVRQKKPASPRRSPRATKGAKPLAASKARKVKIKRSPTMSDLAAIRA